MSSKFPPLTHKHSRTPGNKHVKTNVIPGEKEKNFLADCMNFLRILIASLKILPMLLIMNLLGYYLTYFK